MTEHQQLDQAKGHGQGQCQEALSRGQVYLCRANLKHLSLVFETDRRPRLFWQAKKSQANTDPRCLNPQGWSGIVQGIE